jgi:hypothetical protein
MFSVSTQDEYCGKRPLVNNVCMDDVTSRAFAAMQQKDPPWDWAALARALKTTDQCVYNWRNRRIPPERYQAIADALGVSVDALLGRATVDAISSEPTEPELPQSLPFDDEALLADLAALLPEDAAVWRAQIHAAAVKARRSNSAGRPPDRQPTPKSPPSELSRARRAG